MKEDIHAGGVDGVSVLGLIVFIYIKSRREQVWGGLCSAGAELGITVVQALLENSSEVALYCQNPNLTLTQGWV